MPNLSRFFEGVRVRLDNAREKYDIFPRVFDIANQLLTSHTPFMPLGHVDE